MVIKILFLIFINSAISLPVFHVFHNVQCPDPNSFDCKSLYLDVDQIMSKNQIELFYHYTKDTDLESIFENVTFVRKIHWSVQNCNLVELVPLNYEDFGYMTILYSKKTGYYFAFLEFRGLKITIKSTMQYGPGILQKWSKPNQKSRHKRQLLQNVESDVL